MKHERFELNYVIRAYRMALGLTQADLGYAVYMSAAWVSLYERGKVDGNGLETKMKTWLLKVRNGRKAGKEYYDAKASLILCDIYMKMENCTPETVWTYAQNCCQKFVEA